MSLMAAWNSAAVSYICSPSPAAIKVALVTGTMPAVLHRSILYGAKLIEYLPLQCTPIHAHVLAVVAAACIATAASVVVHARQEGHR